MRITTLLTVPLLAGMIALPTRASAQATISVTFGARLPDDDRPFLRTGDLGFLADGELWFFTMELVTGVDFLACVHGGGPRGGVRPHHAHERVHRPQRDVELGDAKTGRSARLVTTQMHQNIEQEGVEAGRRNLLRVLQPRLSRRPCSWA